MNREDFRCPGCGGAQFTVEQLTWNKQDYDASQDDWSVSYDFDWETEYPQRMLCANAECERDVTADWQRLELMQFFSDPYEADLDIDDEDDDGCPKNDPDCTAKNGDCHDACESPEYCQKHPLTPLDPEREPGPDSCADCRREVAAFSRQNHDEQGR